MDVMVERASIRLDVGSMHAYTVIYIAMTQFCEVLRSFWGNEKSDESVSFFLID
jgi:hypothetical protein